MSSAAAAFRRKPAGRQVGDFQKWEMPERYLKDLKDNHCVYVQIAQQYLEFANRKLTRRGRGLVECVFLETVGTYPNLLRQEWARISHQRFMDVAHCRSIAGISRELNALIDSGIIERQGSQQHYEYRLGSIRKFLNLVDREPDSDPEEKERHEAAGEQGERSPSNLISVGKRISFEFTGRLVQTASGAYQIPLGNGLKIPVAVRMNGGSVELCEPKPIAENNSLKPGELRPTCCPEEQQVSERAEASSEETSCPLVQTVDAVKSELTPVFRQRFGYPPDDNLLRAIQSRLRVATIAYFMRRVRGRFERGGNIQPGLLLKIAEDAERDALEEAAQAARAARSGAVSQSAATPSFEAEPEGSNSPWDRTRRVIAKTIPKEAYSNCFIRTRFRSLADGTLSVEVPDEIARDMIADPDYMDIIKHAAKAAGLDARHLDFVVSGEEPPSA